jgi:hypothetical protein
MAATSTKDCTSHRLMGDAPIIIIMPLLCRDPRKLDTHCPLFPAGEERSWREGSRRGARTNPPEPRRSVLIRIEHPLVSIGCAKWTKWSDKPPPPHSLGCEPCDAA